MLKVLYVDSKAAAKVLEDRLNEGWKLVQVWAIANAVIYLIAKGNLAVPSIIKK